MLLKWQRGPSLTSISQNAKPSFGNIARTVAYILLILTIALGLHLRLDATEHTSVIKPLRADAGQYTAYAYNLKLHGTYSSNKATASDPLTKPEADALRTPGYPLFLYPLVTPNDFTAFINNTVYLQAILGTVTLILVTYLCYLILGPYAAVIVSLLCAISPHLINMGVYILSETLFTLLFILCLTIIIKAQQSNKALYWILAALFLAFSALTRPSVQYFIFFLIFFIWTSTPQEKRLHYVYMSISVFLGVISLWLIRNYLATGNLTDPTFVAHVLQHGMYPEFMFNAQTESYAYPYRFDPDSSRISLSLGNTLTAIWERFLDNPETMIYWYLSKPLYLFQWDMVQGYQEIFIFPVWASPYFLDNGIFPFTLNLMKFLHPYLVWLSFIGMAIAFSPERWTGLNNKPLLVARLLGLVYLYFILIHIASAPFPRYSIPIRPITYILAIFALSTAIRYGANYFHSLRHIQTTRFK